MGEDWIRKSIHEFSMFEVVVSGEVKDYFNRNWRRQDMMSSALIPEHAPTSLKTVYLTLLCAMSAAAFGSHLHLIWEAGGLFTVFCSEASLLWLYFTPPWRVRNRFLLLMVAAFCFGASVGPFIEYFFEINQRVFVRFLQGAAIVFGCVWFAARIHRERSQIYIGFLMETCSLLRLWFDITRWMLKVFMGYLVVYSQEILLWWHCSWGTLWYIAKRYCTMLALEKLTLSTAHSLSSSVYQLLWSMLKDSSWVQTLSNTDRINA